MTKKELKELIKEVISEETQSVDPEEILGKILELTISDTSEPLLILMKIRALAKNYFDKVGYKVNEAGGYKEAISESDSTKEKAKLVYSNLKKREFEYRELTKKTKDPVKKRHFSDMAEKVKNQASDVLLSFLDDMDVQDWFDD